MKWAFSVLVSLSMIMIISVISRGSCSTVHCALQTPHHGIYTRVIQDLSKRMNEEWMEPESATFISCRSVMFTFSCVSSLTMIGVFSMSSVSSRSVVSILVVVVLNSRSPFSQRLISVVGVFFWSSFRLYICFLGFVPVPNTHRSRQTSWIST